ncbi:MAG: HU family DNA-binding protein [Bacteroidetes bacterium]|nr:MAG: HU family DNA-binding protein [Bacteroidota bacterium]RLD82201.1 MAG: HU family DNA-binding protein [Bacteroidota bacterium]
MPITKKEFIKQLAEKMETNEKETEKWVEAYTQTLIDIFKTGEGVTITGLGGFHVSYGYGKTMKFKFNPSQKIKKMMGWSSTFKGDV